MHKLGEKMFTEKIAVLQALGKGILEISSPDSL